MAEHRQRGRPRAFHDTTQQNTINALDRACMILGALSKTPGLTLSELADELSQSPATLYRVLSTFEAHRITEQDPVSQTWHVGPGAFQIGSAFLRRTNIVERARPYMERLMDQTGETANLGIRRGSHVVFLAQVETHQSIRAFFPPGTVSPLHASGIGKALLSAMHDDEIRKLVRSAGLEGFTPRTLTGTEALIDDVALTRRRGYALDDEERTGGMRCVAAVVRSAAGDAVAGISVSGPVNRLSDERIRRFSEHVRQAATALSEDLGAIPA